MKKMRVLALAALATLASAKYSWKEVSSGRQSIVLSFGISGEKTVYGTAIQNGVGSAVIKSNNLGISWNTTGKAPRKELITLAVGSANPESALAAGLFQSQWSIDGGKSWKETLAELGPIQDIAVSNNRKFYAAVAGKGVHISKDFGATFKSYKVPQNDTYQIVTKFGAFPSDDVWYLTAGTAPSLAPTQPPNFIPGYDREEKDEFAYLDEYHHLSHHLAVTPSGNVRLLNADELAAKECPYPKDCYAARMWKTSDAGQTWELQYSDDGRFYFNDVDCCSEDVCYAVGEGFPQQKNKGAGSTDPAAWIFKTEDGKTWKNVLKTNFDVNSSVQSIMSVKCLNNGQEAWASGGNMIQHGFGVWWHTANGGGNWTQAFSSNKVALVAKMGFSPSGKAAMASGITLQSGGVVFNYEDRA